MAKAGGPAAKRARVQGHSAEGAAKVKGADISVEGVEDIAKTVGDDPAQPGNREMAAALNMEAFVDMFKAKARRMEL